jgi:S-adenosylmethionine synthetase
MKVHITLLSTPAPAELPVEIVERKGIGHPDTVCDALAENLGVVLSRYYLERFGFILHHNVDKGLLWGGVARPAFGGGEVLEPMEIYLTGRATREFRGVKIPVEDLAIEASREWLSKNLHALDAHRHVRIHCLVRPSSTELVELFRRSRETGIVLANDTSCGVGYAPLDGLETLVHAVERRLNSSAVKATRPEIGEDIKVMGVRQEDRIALTISCALVGAHVRDLSDYYVKKAGVAALARQVGSAAGIAELAVDVNAADGDTADSIYLTVTGTSAEAGDDGQVGRGNRSNGLITPYRPMNMEAIAGKNPVSHVGKLYNVVAGRIAAAAVAQLAEAEEVYCYLVSQIGRPIHEPQAVDLRVRVAPAADVQDLRPRLTEIVQDHLSGIGTLWHSLVHGDERFY